MPHERENYLHGVYRQIFNRVKFLSIFNELLWIFREVHFENSLLFKTIAKTELKKGRGGGGDDKLE